MSRTANRRYTPANVLLPRIPAPGRLPHPSWRLAGAAGDADTPLSADDFWKRLGL